MDGYTFKDFPACKPTEFAGSEGAITAICWLENTESILAISKCAEGNEVTYASNLFKDEALEWWNTVLQSRKGDATYALSWKKFKASVERKFCPPKQKKEQMANWFINHQMVGANCRECTAKFFE